MACGCNDSITPQPCCNDCPQTNPCDEGCLDIIDAGCIEYTTGTTGCLGILSGTKLDDVVNTLQTQICALQAGGDKFVRISSVDSTSGYLFDKVITAPELSTSIQTAAGQQKLKISLVKASLVSAGEGNPIFYDVDGLNVNYTTLVTTLVNDPTLMALICAAISAC